jgi:prolyl 4-hydroxylase
MNSLLVVVCYSSLLVIALFRFYHIYIYMILDMKKTCAPACQSCDYLTVEGRCPIDPDAPHAWGPGDLNRMFTKLTSEPYLSNYDVEILSRPPHPWIITMQNVVSEVEADRLIELGAIEGYNRSHDVGNRKPDGTYEINMNSGRTSTNAWCQEETCYQDEMAQTVMQRISNWTDIPEVNSEHLQLLRYEPGQYYRVHHDYISHHVSLEQQVG